MTGLTFYTMSPLINSGFKQLVGQSKRCQDIFSLPLVFQAVLRALYAVLSHDISSRICDVALNIIDCLLQLGVVPGMGKKLSKPDNKENQEARAKDPAGQGLGGGAQGGGAVPGAGAGGGGDGGGGGGGGGSGGGSGQGSRDDVKNNKDNDKKVSGNLADLLRQLHKNSCRFTIVSSTTSRRRAPASAPTAWL